VEAISLDPSARGLAVAGRAAPLARTALRVGAREPPLAMLAAGRLVVATPDGKRLAEGDDRAAAAILARLVDRPHVIALVEHARLRDAFRIKAAGWLVEHDDAGFAEERARDSNALAHARRVAADPLVGRPGEPDEREQLIDATTRDPGRRRDHPEVIATRASGMKPGRLQHGADGLAWTLELHVRSSVDQRPSGGGTREAQNHPEGRRLAGAVRAQDRGHLTGGRGEGEVIDRRQIAEPFR
jgi:hypothetical protein